jgi:hypothetical protein
MTGETERGWEGAGSLEAADVGPLSKFCLSGGAVRRPRAATGSATLALG